jgi:hypothetical protein
MWASAENMPEMEKVPDKLATVAATLTSLHLTVNIIISVSLVTAVMVSSMGCPRIQMRSNIKELLNLEPRKLPPPEIKVTGPRSPSPELSESDNLSTGSSRTLTSCTECRRRKQKVL